MAKIRQSKGKRSAREPRPLDPAPESLTAPADLVERYNAMAEELNGRGAMELAVPFYRQTIALLLAEREQWRSIPASPAVADVIAAASQVQALAEAAEAVGPVLGLAELRRRVQALEEELCEANQREVAAALEDLEAQWGDPQPQLLGLRARLSLLAGNVEGARACFEQALLLEPECPRLQHNTGAARLACGDAAGALPLLRSLAAAGDGDPPGASLLKNLARAEQEAGEAERAVEALLQLLEIAPAAFELEAWLAAAEQWLEADQAPLTHRLLEALRPLLSDPAPLLPLLARSHEALGNYREAALLYRDLLRPGLA